MTSAIDAALEDLVSEFDLLGDWEERYRYVIELGRKLAPLPGEVIVEIGAAASVEPVAGVSPGRSVTGCTPMSAKRFTVACCIRMSDTGLPRS